jgi:hypothetical protein
MGEKLQRKCCQARVTTARGLPKTTSIIVNPVDPCDELAFKGYPDLRYFCLDKAYATFVARISRENKIHCWQIKFVKRAIQAINIQK